MSGKKTKISHLFLGAFGSLTYFIGDILMSYGDPTPISDKVGFFTLGISQIPEWRNKLSMILSFVSAVPLAIGLFYLKFFIINETKKTIYHYTLTFSLVGWSVLHL